MASFQFEHIAAGFGAVDDVHQPIRIQGYMVKSAEGTSIGNGLTSGAKSQSGSPCLLGVDDSNKGTYYVIVHSITLPGASVTMDGDADDEWVMGDVPLLGRGGYVVYFLTVAVGGGAGLYVVSSKRVKGVAASQAKVLLGQENMAKAETARKAPKRKAPEPARAAPEPKKEKKPKKKEDSSIGGFDLDAALSTKGSSASSKPERRAAAQALWSRKRPPAWPRKPRPPPLPRPRRQARLGRRRCPPQNDAAAG